MSEDGLTIWRSGQRTGEGGILPTAPAIVLHDPKYPHNVGQIVRLASCYGIPQVWYSGDRVKLKDSTERLPREERMRGYQDVTLINHPDPLERLLVAEPAAVPIAVELRSSSEMLPDFLHPDGVAWSRELGHWLVPPNMQPPIYIFGPEDGSLPGHILKRCHRFLCIPSFQCLNLATSVATVLYDRMSKMPQEQWPQVKDRGVSSARGELATSSHY